LTNAAPDGRLGDAIARGHAAGGPGRRAGRPDAAPQQRANRGHVTKLKLVKRQGYGRAKVDLLRTRQLQAA
jgi:hypothetical protein